MLRWQWFLPPAADHLGSFSSVCAQVGDCFTQEDRPRRAWNADCCCVDACVCVCMPHRC